MAISINDFGKAVVASGLMSADDVKALWDKLPTAARPKSANLFAELLVANEKLSPFQARELLEGRGATLVLGDYVLEQKIGAGGMGQVFKARHRHMERLVAVKLLPPAMTQDEGAVKRFQREVKAAAKLTHPNIVQAYDASVQRGVHYLVMEYVEGKDLSATVKARGPLSVEESLNYITQAARGLAYAHGKGVVHRDIKPANLLLDDEGTVKILDMGLARIDDAKTALAAAEEGLTQSGQVMGTVDYMAPEQAFDTRHADARADVYSLGCSLYKLLTGESVYRGETVVQKFLAHRESPIPSLCAKRPEVPQALDTIFQKMLAKSPDDRYQQASQLVAELEACRLAGAAAIGTASSQFSPTRTFDSASVAVPTDAEDGMTAAMGNQFMRSVPESRSAPREDTFGSSSDERTKGGLRGTKGAKKGAGRFVSWKNPKILISAGVVVCLLAVLGFWTAFRNPGNQQQAGNDGLKDTKTEKKNEPPTKVNSNRKAGVEKPKGDNNGNSAGTINYALEFDGKNSRVEIPTLSWDGKSPLTLEAWVDSPLGNEFPMTVARMAGTGVAQLHNTGNKNKDGMQWAALASKGKAGYPIPISGSTSPQLTAAPWHIAFVIDKSRLLLFENGKLIAQAPHVTSQFGGEVPNASSIGANFENPKQSWAFHFKGRLDEVRFSKSARYVQEFVPEVRLQSDNDTIALYHFDEGSGEVLNDSSGNQHHGKIIGAKWVRNDPPQTPASPMAIPSNAPTVAGTAQSGTIDLLSLVDLKRDAGIGSWNLVPEGLSCNNPVGHSILQFPYTPPEEYDLEVEFTPTAAGRNIAVYLVDHGRVFTWKLNAHGIGPPEHLYAFEMLDGRSAMDADEAKTRSKVLIEVGRRYRTTVEVRRGSLHASLNGKKLIDWSGDVGQRAVTFHSARVREVSGQGKFADGIRAASQMPVIPAEALTFNGHRYLLVDNPSNWNEAKAMAEAMGGHLATINSKAERDWMQQNVWPLRAKTKSPDRIHLGGAQPNKDAPWVWCTGEPFDMSLWLGNKRDDQDKPVFLCWMERDHWDDTTLFFRWTYFLVEWDTLGQAASFAKNNTPRIAIAPFDAAQAKAHQEAWAKHLGTQVETTNSLGAKMILIPPGEFLMGSTDEQVAAALKLAEEFGLDQLAKGQVQNAERPQHSVVITRPFLIGATEVTVGQFKKFCETGYITEAEQAGNKETYLKPGYPVTNDSPVTVMSWNDAAAFCKWLGEQEKTTYRLPTEAEWEYACRAGTTTQFSCGDDDSQLGQFCWFKGNAGGRSHPVATRLPNAFGLFDMHGNACELCNDFYNAKSYDKSLLNDPAGPPVGSNHVIRGGFWRGTPVHCRSSHRHFYMPSSFYNTDGFRIVRTLDVPATTATKLSP